MVSLQSCCSLAIKMGDYYYLYHGPNKSESKNSYSFTGLTSCSRTLVFFLCGSQTSAEMIIIQLWAFGEKSLRINIIIKHFSALNIAFTNLNLDLGEDWCLLENPISIWKNICEAKLGGRSTILVSYLRVLKAN